MKCPKCGQDVSVIETRPVNNQIIRRRRCKKCGMLFYTIERIIDYADGLTAMSLALHQNKTAKRGSV